MSSPFKDFFYFTRQERRGIIILVVLIAIVYAYGEYNLYKRRQPQPVDEKERQQQVDALAEYKAFVASIETVEAKRRQQWEYARYDRQPAPVLATFDPNTADSATFRQLGLPAWMADNILRYRAKGGKFRKAEDFKKIYGLTEEQYNTLFPYIRISSEEVAKNTPSVLYTLSADSTTTDAPYKYPQGTVIELNRADTTELKKIPGIGSGIARMIVGYRERLGGFYDIEQLKEINLNASLLQSWFSVDTTAIRRLNLNRCNVEYLRRHPYINFYQAKAIVEYRRKKGVLNSLKPFALLEEFPAPELERISHYICFE